MQTWLDVSEICFGLVLTGRVDITKYAASMFIEPYDKGFDVFKSTGDKVKTKATISDANYNSALEASKTVSDLNDVEYHKDLLRISTAHRVGSQAEKLGKQLQQGKDVDTTKIIELAKSFKDLAAPSAIGLVPSTEIDWQNYEELHLCGWDAIDKNLGGIASAGNILVMGRTGLGKSFFATKFLCKYLTLYPEKKAAVYSLEMPSRQWVKRAMAMYPDEYKPIHEREQVLISDKIVSIQDIGLEAAALGVDIIVVDYADYLVKGEPSEAAYFKIYTEMNNISRTLEIPFMMLLQPNREQYKNVGVPEMWYARYSGMAENVSAQFWALWKPSDEDETNGDFVFEEEHMYILAHKQRAGWPIKQGPGAIVMKKTKNIWGEDGHWQVRGDVKKSISKHKKGG